MAAITSGACWGMDMAQTAMVATLLLAVAVVVCADGTTTSLGRNDGCATEDTAVFPLYSTCDSPAKYNYDWQGFEFWFPQSDNTRLRLGPVWDGKTDTYFVRVTEDRTAKYVLAHLQPQIRRPYVAQSEPLYIVNLDTLRVLGWRLEGRGRRSKYLLVEIEQSDSPPPLFQFVTYNRRLPVRCPETFPPLLCKAYAILAYNSTSGLAPYVKDGITYFQRSTAYTGFGLVRVPITQSLSLRNAI